jgi:hypothetical protein
MGKNFARLGFSKSFVSTPILWVLVAQHCRGEKRSIDGTRLADGQRADRNTSRHLRNREQRVEPLQCLRFDWHAKDRQTSFRRAHPGQVRRSARARNDDLEPALRRCRCVLEEPIGCAVSGDDLCFVGTLNSSSCAVACCIVSQSDCEPMMTPTRG